METSAGIEYTLVALMGLGFPQEMIPPVPRPTPRIRGPLTPKAYRSNHEPRTRDPMDRSQAFSLLGLTPGDGDEKLEAAFAARMRVPRDRSEISRLEEAYQTLKGRKPGAAAQPEALEPGRRLRGRYEIRTRRGDGESRVLYTAFDLERGEEVCIELLRPGLADGLDVDARVATHLAAIESAAVMGVARIAAFEREGDLRWLVGESLTGGTLRAEIDERRGRGSVFSVEEVRSIGKALCRTIKALHGASVFPVIGPESVRLTSDGQVKLTDTGLARLFAPANASPRASTAGVPPEASLGAASICPQTAQHSLALLLSEMLAVSSGISAGSPDAPPESRPAAFPLQHRSDLPRSFAAALQRALSPDPAHRFPDLEAFADGMGAKAARFDLRKPAWAAAVGILLIAAWATYAAWGPAIFDSWRKITRDPRLAVEAGTLRKEAQALAAEWKEQLALQAWSSPLFLSEAASIDEGDRRWEALRDEEALQSFREARRTLQLAVTALKLRATALAERASGSEVAETPDPVEMARKRHGEESIKRGDEEIRRGAYENARTDFEEAREALRQAEGRRTDRKAAGEDLRRVREGIERLASEEKRIAEAVDRASIEMKAAAAPPGARQSLAMLERLVALRKRGLRGPGEDGPRLAEMVARSAEEMAAGDLDGARRHLKETGETSAALLLRGEEIEKTVREEFAVQAILDWVDLRISRFVPAVPARLAAARDALARGRHEAESLAFSAALGAYTEAARSLDSLIIQVPEEQPTVQQGIYAAEEGDVVRVKAGLHQGSLKMKSGVLLVGDDPDTTILRCEATEDLLAATGCRSGLVSGLTLEHPGTQRDVAMEIGEPVKLHGNRLVHAVRSRLTIADCTLRNAVFGILSSRSTLTVRANRLEACMLAIGIDSSGESVIEGNRIDDFRAIAISVVGKDAAPELRDNKIRSAAGVGIYFGGGARGLAEANTIESCMYGIYVTDPETAPRLVRNVCRSLAASGLYFGKGAGGDAESNRCEENQVAGIFLENLRTAPTLRENNCRANRGPGVRYSQGAGGVARQNRCETNGFGMLLQGPGTAPSLHENHLIDNRLHGLFFEGGSGGVAEGNIARGNLGSGIAIHESSPTIRKNTCANNRSWGIDASRAILGTVVEDNVATGNQQGDIRGR